MHLACRIVLGEAVCFVMQYYPYSEVCFIVGDRCGGFSSHCGDFEDTSVYVALNCVIECWEYQAQNDAYIKMNF